MSRLTHLGYPLLAWGAVVTLAAVPLQPTSFEGAFLVVGLGAATAGLVLGIVGAARYDPLQASGEAARSGIVEAAKTRTMTEITRHIARRDARAEGEPDVEPSAHMSDGARAMKEAQRDLTSLSGPVPRGEPEDEKQP